MDQRLVGLAQSAAAVPPDPGPAAERRARAVARWLQVAPHLISRTGPSTPVTEEVVGPCTVRIYRPRADEAALHVYLHGGGWWGGSVDSADAYCRRLAATAGCVVASVDYRLAPEHPFPAGLEDCYGTTVALADEARRRGDAVSLGGTSAGGNLAVGTAILMRDRAVPPVSGLVLEVPAVDLTLRHESQRTFAEGHVLTHAAVEECVEFYLADPELVRAPLVSPIYADLTGLPPMFVATAECDPLRDEAEEFVSLLLAAGVPVTARRWLGQIHGSMPLDLVMPEVAAMYDFEVSEFLRTQWRRSRLQVASSG